MIDKTIKRLIEKYFHEEIVEARERAYDTTRADLIFCYSERAIARIKVKVDRLEEENRALIEVLEFYSEGNSHHSSKHEWGENHSKTCGTETRPSGEKARQALEKIKGIRRRIRND